MSDDPTRVGDLIGEALADTAAPWPLRKPCQWCGEPEAGLIERRNGQATVRCATCGKHCYNAPRTETGEAARTIASLHNISPGTQARIKERATFRCELCGQRGILHVGHILSVADGLVTIEDGLLTGQELGSDENLVLLCESCNLGFGRRSLPVRLLVALLRVRLTPPRGTRDG